MGKLIRVHSRFEFRKSYRESKIFDIGLHEVSDEDAAHWFVAGHSEIVKDIPKEPVVEYQRKRGPQQKNGTEPMPQEEPVKEPIVKQEAAQPAPVDDSYIGQIKKKLGY